MIGRRFTPTENITFGQPPTATKYRTGLTYTCRRSNEDLLRACEGWAARGLIKWIDRAFVNIPGSFNIIGRVK